MFEYYLNVPSELRKIMVVKNEAADRCRLSGCSKLCNEEAKASKNHIHSLAIRGYTDNQTDITVVHISVQHSSDEEQGYQLKFEEEEGGNKLMRYVKTENQECWVDKLDRPTNLVKCASDYFKKQLKLYHKTIKCLSITGFSRGFDIEDNWGIDKFKNLEELRLERGVSIREIFSKTQKPLKKLRIQMMMNRTFSEIEQIFQVQEYLELDSFKLNYQDFSRFSASRIHVGMGELTEEDISNFIKLWQNGNLRENFEWCYWEFSMFTHFNVTRLLTLLGIEQRTNALEFGVDFYDIKHNKDASKMAKLKHDIFGYGELKFSVLENDSYF